MAVVISEYPQAPVELHPEIRDYFPILFYCGDEVVEIKMVEAIYRNSEWEFVERGTILENPGREITRVVFEGPQGCYEALLAVPPGGKVIVRDDYGGAPWYPCN